MALSTKVFFDLGVDVACGLDTEIFISELSSSAEMLVLA